MSIYLVISLIFVYYAIIPIVLNCLATKKWVYWIYLLLFVPVLVCGVFGKVTIGKTVTLTFERFGNFFNKDFNFYPFTKDFGDIVINTFMLVPIGISVYNLSNKQKLVRALLFGLGVGCFIEIMQLILPIARSPQLSDIILNGISGLLGGVYAMILSKIKGKKSLSDDLSNQNANKKTSTVGISTNSNNLTEGQEELKPLLVEKEGVDSLPSQGKTSQSKQTHKEKLNAKID